MVILHPRPFLLLAVALWPFAPIASSAATYYWGGGSSNISGTGTPGGGTGTWNATVQNWTLNSYAGSGSGYVAWPNSTNDNAVFGGTAGTVTIGAGVALGDLAVETSNHIFTIGGNITLTNNSFSGAGLASSTFQATSGSRTLIFAGTGASTFSGRLRNGGGTLGFRLGSSREVSLTATNSDYTGVTALFAGLLNISSIANGGAASSIGASSSAASNLSFGNSSASATLNYVGPGQGTDRLFTLTGTTNTVNHRILNSGSGPLVFSNTGSVVHAGTANLSRTFSLGGNNTDNNTFAPRLADNGTGPVNMMKIHAGTWILTGSNTYSGTTTVGGGTLLIEGNQSAASGAVTVSFGATLGGAGTVGGAVTFESGASALLSVGSPMTINGNLTVNTNTVKVNLPNNLPIGNYPLATFGGSLSGSFASVPIVVSGSIAPGTTSFITTGAGSVILRVRTAPPSDTTMTIDSSLNPSSSGRSVTFTAMIAPNQGSAAPTGTVQFKTNGSPLGPPVAVVPGVNLFGVASINTSTLPVGTTAVTAEYSATGLFNNSSGTLSGGQVVTASAPNANTVIPYITNFPTTPNPLVIRDWKQTALDYHELALSPASTGQHLPLLSEYSISTAAGYFGPAFALPSYVGRPSGTGEALSVVGAVLGGTLAGRDMANFNGSDRVAQSEVYFSVVNGRGLVFNGVNSQGSGSAWYDIYPSILFYELGSRYPGRPTLQAKMTAIADSWLTALPVLSNNWEHTGFDFQTMTTTDSAWKEPDMAIGIAWLQYMAYARTGDPKYLAAADTCMTQMNNRSSNPVYEVLGYYGPLLAARMKAEVGRSYSSSKHLNWVFASTSAARTGWGSIGSRWGSYDAYGLMGSTMDTGGYAFSMNTFAAAGAIAPVVRYEPQYARLLGRWLLHVAANANLFYPSTLPANMQANAIWVQSTGVQCIPYEGVRRNGATVPYATGDADTHWPGQSILNFTPYGAWSSGYMAALYRTSNIAGILQVDCVATDSFPPATHPTYLYYNPHGTAQQVTVEVGAGSKHIYNLVTGAFIATNVTGSAMVSVPPDASVVAVICPANSPITQSGRRLMVGGVVVDHWNALLDSDNDGLPDWWESRYYGNSTNAQPQALGANQTSNIQSYRLGLNPTDPNSRFRALVGRQAGTGFPQVSWSSVGGKRYSVEFAGNFTNVTNFAPALTVTSTNAPAGAEGWMNWVDDGTLTGGITNTPARFYRVKLVDP